MTEEQIIEAMARAIVESDGGDPDEIVSVLDRGPPAAMLQRRRFELHLPLARHIRAAVLAMRKAEGSPS